jgi:hypothetical protein
MPPMRTLLAAAVAAMMALALTAAAPAGVAPKARFKKTPRAPKVGQVVRFDASASKCKRCGYRWHVVRRRSEPRRLGSGKVLRHTFRTPGTRRIRLTLIDRQGDKSRRTRKIRIRRAGARGPAPANPPAQSPGAASPTPPIAKPFCAAGATPATTAAAVRSAVQAGQNVCVTAPVGNVSLDGLKSSGVRNIGTSGSGSMGIVHMDDASSITLNARFRSTVMRRSNLITIEQSIIGGTPDNRTLDQLIFIPERSDDVTIRDNDIGWTAADNSGNTGYGIRAYADSARLRIERNHIHHIGGDAIQLGMNGADTLIDRNEIAYAARPMSSNEHSDDLQIVSHGPNMRVTNNYFHHCGWFTENGPTTGCNSMAIHAGTNNTLLFENNIEAHALGLPFIGDLGTGGCNRSNAIFRNNTWWDNGTQFTDKPDLTFALCGGSNNLWERNLVVSKLNNSYGFAASGTVNRDSLVGAYAIDAATGNCTAAACNPASGPIGFRKPSGVHW